MSVTNLTSAVALALCLPTLALLALSVYYAGALTALAVIIGAASLGLNWAAYLLFSKKISRPIEALVRPPGQGEDIPRAKGPFPAEIEALRTYVLSASTLLEEYRHQHMDLLMSVPDILLEIGLDGRINFMNKAASLVTGYSEDDALGRHFIDFVSPVSRQLAQDVFASILEGKPASSVELKLTLSDGDESFFEFNSVPLWKDGAVAGCCCIGRDIDERRKIMDELEAARRHAEEASAKLKKTVNDLEEFSLLAVRREVKMQELREMFVRLKEEHEINKDFPG